MSLTSREQHAMELTGELARVLREIIGTGPNANEDWNEAAGKVHDIQRLIMSQSAARAHPYLYRLLGQDLKPDPGIRVHVDPAP